MTITFKRVTLLDADNHVLPPVCGEKRGPRAKTTCELPPGHEGYHLGRSQSGKWFGWGIDLRDE